MFRILLTLLCTVSVAGNAAADDPFGDAWPAGPNRELTGAFCGSCHSLAIVRQQGLDRSGWDALLTWMSETQNMPVVDTALRNRLLDYLEMSFGPEGRTSVATQTRLIDSESGLQGADLTPLMTHEE